MGAWYTAATRSSAPSTTRALQRASAIDRSVRAATGRPARAAPMVGGLSPAARARSEPDHPRRAISTLRRWGLSTIDMDITRYEESRHIRLPPIPTIQPF
jgi:hypothetical protein